MFHTLIRNALYYSEENIVANKRHFYRFCIFTRTTLFTNNGNIKGFFILIQFFILTIPKLLTNTSAADLLNPLTLVLVTNLD